MPAIDKTSEYLGWGKWPVTIAIFAVQLAYCLAPPAWLGAILMPMVVGFSTLAQNVLRFARGEDLMANSAPIERIETLAVLPLTVIMVILLYSTRVITTQMVRRFVPSDGDARKFGECMLRVIYYTPMFAISYYLSRKQKYWPEAVSCWTEFATDAPRSLELEAAYVLEFSFYLGGIFIHVFIDNPLKDYWVMLFHHVVTVLLLGMSYEFGTHGIGMLVLVVHDLSDVYLDLAKCLHYTKMELLSTVTFVNLIISWIVYRLYHYPFMVLNSVFKAPAYIEEMGHAPIPYYPVFVTLLVMLQVLQVYWFYLILRVAYVSIVSGEIEDVRDDEAMSRLEKDKYKDKNK